MSGPISLRGTAWLPSSRKPLMSARLAEPDQTSGGRPETAIFVEPGEMRLVIDMKPMGTAITGDLHGAANQRCGNTSTAVVWMDAGIEN